MYSSKFRTFIPSSEVANRVFLKNHVFSYISSNYGIIPVFAPKMSMFWSSNTHMCDYDFSQNIFIKILNFCDYHVKKLLSELF